MLSNFVGVVTQEQVNFAINMFWEASLVFTSIPIYHPLFYISVFGGRTDSDCTVHGYCIFLAFFPKQHPALSRSWLLLTTFSTVSKAMYSGKESEVETCKQIAQGNKEAQEDIMFPSKILSQTVLTFHVFKGQRGPQKFSNIIS